jgi:hypothetical protein
VALMSGDTGLETIDPEIPLLNKPFQLG